MSEPYSIIKPVGFTIASCGYCGSENSAHVYGAFAYKLTCKDYQDLLDQGWRRFGLYLYKPNLRDSCCRQYTICVNTSEFTPSKGQRRTVARFNRYIKNQYVPLKISRESVVREDTAVLDEHSHSPSPEPALSVSSHYGVRRKSTSPPIGNKSVGGEHADFIQSIHAADADKQALDSEFDWKDFRTEALISTQDNTGFVGYGTYHQCYYVDGKLIAVSVLDILPRCISSGYFYYDPMLSSLSLGKYSTLREIALVQEIKSIPGFHAMEYYTMGHYVAAAPKTHYKALYQPSYLLDPETHGWVPFEKCIHLLQSKQYFSFSDSELFNPRVKGLLITMAVERRAREKTKELSSSHTNTTMNDFSCHMDTSTSGNAEALGIQEKHQNDHHGHGSSSRRGNSDDEGLYKRKRSFHDGVSSPSEYMRGGKRPSLTPPPSTLSSLPPPGMMNPEDVSDQDLSQLVVFKDDKAMMLTDSDTFCEDKKAMREYYAAVGPALAPKMLIFAQ
ncbi:Arginyl-tRNA--protein transferase 1 [Mortierella claussenii]|nr:Arginyl-tRNA--protein transferase 1 [Mortierella claussenii]